MAKNSSVRVPEDAAATAAEIEAAIQSLTEGELRRLALYAGNRIQWLGRRAMGRQTNDLIQEAFTLTLEGRRRWNKHNVDLVGHLIGVIRSHSSHLLEKFDPDEARLESDLPVENAAGARRSPTENSASSSPGQEDELIAKQTLDEILDLFSDDEDAGGVILARIDGKTGPEIQKELGLSASRYEAAIKRIQRNASKCCPKGATK